MKIAVLLTCHNRKEKTTAFLRSLAGQTYSRDCELDIFLNDDGSEDGTKEAVLNLKGILNNVGMELYIVEGSGYDYWCGGMRRAWCAALEHESGSCRYSYFLWANDDVILENYAVSELLKICNDKACSPVGVVCGCFKDPETGVLTYGGRDDRRLLIPNGRPQKCRYIHGNTVLVPRGTFDLIGNFDSRWTHGFGDSDYGLCCIEKGLNCWTTSRYIGTCRQHRITAPWFSSEIPLLERIALARKPVGGNFREYVQFRRKHYPVRWGFDVLKFIVEVIVPLPFEIYQRIRGE